MDPFAALKALDEAIASRDRQGVFEYSDALIGWLRGRGFNPWDKWIGLDWRAMLPSSEIIAYLEDLNHATGIAPNGEDVE